jgi:hypothetical protein
LYQCKKNASIAEPDFCATGLAGLANSAPTNVSRHIAAHPVLTTKQGHALSAGQPLLPTSTPTPNAVVGRVLSVCDYGKADFVYDLTIDGQHEFYANGVLVHNCIDALRYAIGPLIKAPKQDIVMDIF